MPTYKIDLVAVVTLDVQAPTETDLRAAVARCDSIEDLPRADLGGLPAEVIAIAPRTLLELVDARDADNRRLRRALAAYRTAASDCDSHALGADAEHEAAQNLADAVEAALDGLR
ncbi:hypothetical protein [Bailinhaonella thermotolerans]|uniref:Uncharacterized protein n=1 Tax=Bailinhaonella thermotolerans TaxID=1070861 RepID=A0A3A4AP37_9ACTN|nr:hypothetical protein [Bailinhaonella thermotolerans]RJL21025.1 hypothetical protein D5H75_38070 [Bailinhaonella thermotolerans]